MVHSYRSFLSIQGLPSWFFLQTCSKAIDRNEWLIFFKHKKRKDKRYLSVNGFLTEKGNNEEEKKK